MENFPRSEPIPLEPMENFPRSEPIPLEPILVSNPIRINPIEIKEYLSFAPILKDNVNLGGEKYIKVPQEPLLEGSKKVEKFPNVFINGIPLQYDRDRSIKVRFVPKGK